MEILEKKIQKYHSWSKLDLIDLRLIDGWGEPIVELTGCVVVVIAPVASKTEFHIFVT
jgi:hypothetical protein